MPESEPKPKLIELVAPGAGQGWKAVLRNGKPAVVHEIPVPPAEAQAAVPRLQRLYEHRHPSLSPVLAWGSDQNGVWVAVEPNEGTPLQSILTRGPLTPPAAAALGAAVLSGVAALHEAGIAMGGFGATAVRVTTNGEVRIAGHPAAAVRGAPSQSDLRADVRSCGMAVCAAFGVDPAGAPAPPNIAPGLVVTMRSMASGAMGPSADRAQAAMREMAAGLLSPDREMAAQSELATRAGGRELPPITPFLPEGTVAPPPPPRPSQPVAPYIAPPTREETPVRKSASYDAPDRPVQTYPSMPAITFPPAPAPSAPAPPPPPPAVPATPAASVPTWSEAPPRPSSPFEEVTSTNPPAPAPVEPPKAPEPPRWLEPEPANTFPTPEPATPAPLFSTSPPTPAAPPAPPAPAPQAPPPVAPAPSSQPTWSQIEQPTWKPGRGVPAEPLGTGTAIETRPPAPEPVRTPTPPPAPRRPVPRPPSRGAGGISLADRPPWLVPAAVAVGIVLLLGIFGVIIFNRGSNQTAQTHGTPTPHTSGTPRPSPGGTPTPSGGHTPQTVPSYAPANADPVKSVQICTTDNPCQIPGSSPESATACTLTSCKVEVAIYFTAVQKSVAYKYDLKFFDRCSGTTTDLPGPNSATTPPTGYIVAIPSDHWSVSIPSNVKSGALVAVTSAPAVAASAPLLLGAATC